MNFDRTAYGKRVQALRRSKKITQEQLAEVMNVTGTYIVKIENCQRTGSVELAIDLAEYFGVSLDYLLLGGEQKSTKQKLHEVIQFLSDMEKNL